jgi:hypothetical protein
LLGIIYYAPEYSRQQQFKNVTYDIQDTNDYD